MDTSSEKLTTALVSITMATYNRASYLRDAIESVLAQTYPHWELIIVDDGSTDSTKEIIASFNDPRIRVLAHQTNQGIHASRTDGLNASQGTYIAVLDSDDLWIDPEKLATQVTFLDANPGCVIVGTFIHAIGVDGTLLQKNTYCTEDRSIRAHILLRNQFAHSSVLMRADAVRTAGGYQKVPLGEDLDLFLRLGRVGTLSNISLFMTAYRIHDSGASRNGVLMARSVLGFIRTYRTHYPNAFLAYLKSTLVLLVAHVHDTRTVGSTGVPKGTG